MQGVLLLIVWMLSCVARGEAQDIKSRSRVLDDQQTRGYETTIPYPYKEVRRDWWKFLRNLGKLSLHSSHWTLSTAEGPILYSLLSASEVPRHTYIYIGLLSTSASEKRLLAQLSELLSAFTISLEKSFLEEQLTALKKKRSKKTAELNWLRKQHLHEPSSSTEAHIQSLETEIESLFAQQDQIIKELSQLGD